MAQRLAALCGYAQEINMSHPPDQIAPDAAPVRYSVNFASGCEALQPYLGGYHGFGTRIGDGVFHEEMVLPSWTNIQVQSEGDDWPVRFGKQPYQIAPPCAVFGPTSNAFTCQVINGHIIGVYLMPRGWARLVGKDASKFADRVEPMSAIFGHEDADAIHQGVLDAKGDFDAQVAAFERVLLKRLEASKPEPPEIAVIEAMLLDPDVRTVDQAMARVGMEDWKFARFVRRHFGFTPKMLMRRARFIRSLLAIRDNPGQGWASVLDEAYVDQSHFIRDCRDFLNMTPGQFAARYQPVANASYNERTRILGDPHHVLQDAAGGD